MKKVLILQPYLDQSRSLAKFLKKYSADYQTVGGFFDGDRVYQRIPNFDVITRLSLDRLLHNTEFDVIVPTGTKSTKMLFSNIGQLQIGNITFNASNLIGFDKCALLRIMKDIDIPIPVTYRKVSDITDFPIFYKEAFEEGFGRRGVIYKKEDILNIPAEKPLIFQEYINTPETYGIGFLAREGNIITYFNHRELISAPKIGGSGAVLTEYHNKQLLTYSKAILEHLHYSGFGLLEFKFCPKRNDFVFMELNPKLWASIEFAFLNNPTFLKELFGVIYPSQHVKCLMYLDRLASFGLREYISLGIRYKKCYKLNFVDSLVELGKYTYKTSKIF